MTATHHAPLPPGGGRNDHRLCTDDCRYRALYEGSQTSLSDLAGKQAEALGFHGRLRNGLIDALKSTFPREFAQAEVALGRRFQDCDDRVLVAYVGVLAGAKTATSNPMTARTVAPDLAALRGALSAAGFALPAEDDPDHWAVAVRAQQASLVPPVTSQPSPPTPASPNPVSVPSDLAALFDDPVPNEPSPPDESAWSDDQPPMEAYNEPGFDDDSYEPDPSGPPPSSRPRRAPKGRGGTAKAAKPAPQHRAPQPERQETQSTPERPEPAPEPAPQGSVAPEPPLPIPEPTETPAANDKADEPDQTTSAPAQPAGPRPRRSMREVASGSTPSEDLAALFDGPPVTPQPSGDVRDRPSGPHPGDPDPEDVLAQLTGTTPPAAPAPTPTDTPPEPAMRPMSTSTPTHGPSAPVPPASAPAPAAETPPSSSDAPVRPEMLPMQGAVPKTRRRGGNGPRPIRVSASAPDASVDVPGTANGASNAELTDEVRKSFAASVAVARPVFISDLANQVDSADIASAWESECVSSSRGEVRFIAAKTRHRARGSLVLPAEYLRTAAAEFTRTWWAGCINRYRGARLYELGVLLHRVGDEVVSHRLGEHTAVFRLRQPRGLVGVCVVLDPKLDEGDPARAALVADIEELLSERLELLVLLTTNADAVDRVTEVAVEEAGRRKWNPTMNVVAARSWEYADQNNSAIRHVLGG